MIKKLLFAAAIGLTAVPQAGAWNDILNSVWGSKGNDTGGIIPWTPENERASFEIASAQCAPLEQVSRWRPASTAYPAITSPTSACGIRRRSRWCGTTAAST